MEPTLTMPEDGFELLTDEEIRALFNFDEC